MKKKTKNGNKVLRYLIPIAVMLIAAGFIFYGTKNGEIEAVFNKAINLCRECVGISGT